MSKRCTQSEPTSVWIWTYGSSAFFWPEWMSKVFKKVYDPMPPEMFVAVGPRPTR